MLKKEKQSYIAPAIEVMHMEPEGVIATSGNVSNVPGKPWGANTRSYGKVHSNSSPTELSDLEDLINDILTMEN
ncbi:hypothetical protein D0T87_18165 [Bacteroides sp. 51]|nr:hypothetical protein [Bacteroides sp. 51]